MNESNQKSEPATVTTNGIEIVYDTFGDPATPPMVLIMGLGTQMIAWEEEFCQMVAGHGYWVIRFDNRDIGLSTKLHEAGVPDPTSMMMTLMQGQSVNASNSKCSGNE